MGVELNVDFSLLIIFLKGEGGSFLLSIDGFFKKVSLFVIFFSYKYFGSYYSFVNDLSDLFKLKTAD